MNNLILQQIVCIIKHSSKLTLSTTVHKLCTFPVTVRLLNLRSLIYKTRDTFVFLRNQKTPRSVCVITPGRYQSRARICLHCRPEQLHLSQNNEDVENTNLTRCSSCHLLLTFTLFYRPSQSNFYNLHQMLRK